MRTWQVERRKRTRRLIELGGLVVKAGIVELTGDDRAVVLGAFLWTAEKLRSDQGEHARTLWAAIGKEAFALEQTTDAHTISQETPLDPASMRGRQFAIAVGVADYRNDIVGKDHRQQGQVAGAVARHPK